MYLQVALRRQQAQEENEAKELSALYGTSCETILALKRSIVAKSDAENSGNEDQTEFADEEFDQDEADNKTNLKKGKFNLFKMGLIDGRV